MPAALCLSLFLASLPALAQAARARLPDSKAVVLRRVSVVEAAFFRVMDGKLVQHWGFADSQSLMPQLMAPARENGRERATLAAMMR